MAVAWTSLRQAAFSLAARPPPARPAVSAAVQVSVAIARTEDIPIIVSGIGTVQAYNAVAVKSRVDGEIQQVLFKEGQDVKAGDPLILIDPRLFQAQFAQTQAMRAKDQATLDGALRDLNRYDNLVQRDFASHQQLDQQHALVDATRAQILNDEGQIAYAQTQLAYATIRAPINGRIGIRRVDVGNFVHASDTGALVSITQLQPISVIFAIPAGDVARSQLIPGEVHVPVIAYAADNMTRLDEGVIDMVDNTVDPATGTIKLKATFQNAALRLWPGNFVNGRLVVDVRHAAVTIPSDALLHGPNGDFVWIVNADDTVASQLVTAGQADQGRVLIEHGLNAGQRVVTDGYFRLDNKTRVEIVVK